MLHRHSKYGLTALALVLLAACAPKTANDSAGAAAPAQDHVTEKLSGGEATVFNQSASSRGFENPAPNLSPEHFEMHTRGDFNFEKEFVQGPNSGHPEHEGLGPVFNNTSCLNCHARDGRGALPALTSGQLKVKFGANEGLLLRISIENEETARAEKSAQNRFGAPVAVPGFSDQLFHRGVYGLRSDSPGSGQADIWMSYRTEKVHYADGETIELRAPVFEITNAYDGPQSRLYQNDVRVSPRMSPPMIGLGLLEAITDEAILAQADPDDRDHDGISGKPNWVFDAEKARAGNPHPVSIGRFGWKGSTPSVEQQSLGALNGDMGVTNYLNSGESIAGTVLFDLAKMNGLVNPIAGRANDASDEVARSIVFYSQTLGVPARRNVTDAIVIQGGRLFDKLACARCHTPSYTTGVHPSIAEFSGQKIYPYTDMLLHDMGPGLADGRRDFDADGNEWKTRPLWGVGLTQTVNPRAGFLHDGRARTLEEAILWHGGEAETSRSAFMSLSKTERRAVIAFLQSL